MATQDVERIRVRQRAWTAYDQVWHIQDWDEANAVYVDRNFNGYQAFRGHTRVSPQDSAASSEYVVTLSPDHLPSQGRLRVFQSATESGKLLPLDQAGRQLITIVGDDAFGTTRHVASGVVEVEAGVSRETD